MPKYIGWDGSPERTPPPPGQNPGIFTTGDGEYDLLKRPVAPPVQPMLSVVPHLYVSRVMAIVLIFGYVISISGILMTHGSVLSWAVLFCVFAVNVGVYTPDEYPHRRDYGTDAPPPVDKSGKQRGKPVTNPSLDNMKKDKSPSDLMARLIDQALGNHNKIAIEVWNDFGWAVKINSGDYYWNMSKQNVVISDSNAIEVDGHYVYFPRDNIYVPGVWAQYVISDLKQIAEEVQNRIAHARRLEKINRYLAVREKRERARLLELAVNDTDLFAGWDEDDPNDVFELEGV